MNSKLFKCERVCNHEIEVCEVSNHNSLVEGLVIKIAFLVSLSLS